MEININEDLGTIEISKTFDPLLDNGTLFSTKDSEYIFSINNLDNVVGFKKFNYVSTNEIKTRFLKTYYRISRDLVSWTDWVVLDKDIDFPTINPKNKLHIEIKWIRKGSSTASSIELKSFNLSGTVLRNGSDLTDDSFVGLKPGEKKIVAVPDIYKVFRIKDIEILSSNNSGLNIQWRYSQDNSRTWSNFEPFTKENVTTKRINPIRFFQIEYSVENVSNQKVSLQDINLIGEVQNISKDYNKTNLIGIRECCKSNLLGSFDSDGNFIPNTNLNQTGGSLSGSLPQTSDSDVANFYNPYQQKEAVNLLNKLSSDAEHLFGHRVNYFVTDPDRKGQDHTLNEYQLFNVVCEAEIKVSVVDNKFPDNQIVMNQFDLNLFETMEVHITKESFKKVFGKQRRPSKEDFLYFCDINRMFQVDHAQQFRSFNNVAVYYKLILKKYSQKSNVKADNKIIEQKISELTKNSTIDELFGIEQTQDKQAVANKQQHKPLTQEPIRHVIQAEIDKELIQNSTTVISKSNYDLSTVNYLKPAVVYKNLRPELKVSDNIGYTIWFNIHNYIEGEMYNLFNSYDETNQIGWKSNIIDDAIVVNLNTTEYRFDLLGEVSNDNSAIEEETWYCYVFNLDQRQRKLNQYVYKRNVESEEDAERLRSDKLLKVYESVLDVEPIEYELESFNPSILGSDMKVTNIRLYSDILPVEIHDKVLNQYIIGDDSKYLYFGDNATQKLSLPSFKIGGEPI